MAVSFGSYEIPRSGLFVNERGLYVTGHNVSNVNTPGYVRQQAMITTGPYQNEYDQGRMYQLGLGADIQQIRQIRHIFLDSIYRRESSTSGYWENRNKTLQDVQSILGEPMGAGLQNVMNQFWDSWQELSKEPDSLTVRALVRQRAEALTHHINHIGTQMDKLQNDLNSEIKVRINEVNEITGKIADLNVTILKTEVSGDAANDFRDQRNTLVDRLSKLVDAEVNEMQDGQLDITLGGYFLVSKGISSGMYASESAESGTFLIPKLVGYDVEVPLKNGLIKGLMESRGEVFGATGSYENGTPNTKADIVIAVDISNTSAGYLANVKANIIKYVNELKKTGVNYNLHLMTYGNNVASSSSYGTDGDALALDIHLSTIADTGNNFGGTNGLLEELENFTGFRPNANRYAMVFTGESMDGNGGTAVTDATSYVNRLNALGINTSVVTNSAYYNNGDPAGEAGWSDIANGTGGNLYDINTAIADYGTTIGADTTTSVNGQISIVNKSNNIIPEVRKRLNALVNIMAREVNYLHKSGKTLTNLDGDDFFVPMDDSRPMEIGNIKLKDNLLNLNYVVASASGASGDNNIALKIANLRNEPVMLDLNGTTSMDDYYQSIILEVGNSGSDALRISENQQKLVQSADSYRQSIMGVSMDEEMTNMMKYKYAYDASARALNVIDEMMESIINRLGLVGR